MPSGQMLRLRVQHDARGFEARGGHDHHARAHFDFLPGLAIDVGHAARQAVLIDEHVLRERIGAQFQVAGRLGPAAETERRREERARLAAGRAGAAEVARGTAFVILRQLRDAVGQIRNADLAAAFVQDVVEAAEIERAADTRRPDCSGGSERCSRRRSCVRRGCSTARSPCTRAASRCPLPRATPRESRCRPCAPTIVPRSSSCRRRRSSAATSIGCRAPS